MKVEDSQIGDTNKEIIYKLYVSWYWPRLTIIAMTTHIIWVNMKKYRPMSIENVVLVCLFIYLPIIIILYGTYILVQPFSKLRTNKVSGKNQLGEKHDKEPTEKEVVEKIDNTNKS